MFYFVFSAALLLIPTQLLSFFFNMLAECQAVDQNHLLLLQPKTVLTLPVPPPAQCFGSDFDFFPMSVSSLDGYQSLAQKSHGVSDSEQCII